MSEIFISAEEARKRSQSKLDQRSQEELASIFKEINQAIAVSKFTIYWYRGISVPVEEKLKQLGFCVKYESERNEGFYCINW